MKRRVRGRLWTTQNSRCSTFSPPKKCPKLGENLPRVDFGFLLTMLTRTGQRAAVYGERVNKKNCITITLQRLASITITLQRLASITITLQRLASFGFASAGNKRGNCANEDESQYTRYCSCTCWGSRPADHLVSAEGADSEKQDLSLLQLTDADAKSKRHSGQAKVQSCPKIDQTYHLQVLHILDCLPI